jgi:hypothetical protein
VTPFRTVAEQREQLLSKERAVVEREAVSSDWRDPLNQPSDVDRSFGLSHVIPTD